MKREIFSGIVAVISVLTLANLPTTSQAGGSTQLSADPQQVAIGDTLYRQFCQRCHGASLRSSGASTFDLRQFPAAEHERFIESVTEGSGDMPPHGDVLAPDEIEALFAYVIATQEKPES